MCGRQRFMIRTSDGTRNCPLPPGRPATWGGRARRWTIAFSGLNPRVTQKMCSKRSGSRPETTFMTACSVPPVSRRFSTWRMRSRKGGCGSADRSRAGAGEDFTATGVTGCARCRESAACSLSFNTSGLLRAAYDGVMDGGFKKLFKPPQVDLPIEILSDEFGTAGETLREIGILEQADDGGGELSGRIGDQKRFAVLRADGFGGLARGDDRLAGRERFENLILNSLGDAEGRDDGGGTLEVRVYLRNGAGDDDAWQLRELLDRG